MKRVIIRVLLAILSANIYSGIFGLVMGLLWGLSTESELSPAFLELTKWGGVATAWTLTLAWKYPWTAIADAYKAAHKEKE